MIISSASLACWVVEGSEAGPGVVLASLYSWAEFFGGVWVTSSLSTLGALPEMVFLYGRIYISSIGIRYWRLHFDTLDWIHTSSIVSSESTGGMFCSSTSDGLTTPLNDGFLLIVVWACFGMEARIPASAGRFWVDEESSFPLDALPPAFFYSSSD